MTARDNIYSRLAQVVRTAANDVITVLINAQRDPRNWERVEFAAGQGGSPPRRIDRLVADAWVRALHEASPGIPIHIAGEESDDEPIDAIPVGSYYMSNDPFDGTSVHAATGKASSTTQTFYFKSSQRLEFLGTSVIPLDVTLEHWWADESSTWRGGLDQPVTADTLVASPANGRYRSQSDWLVCAVGAQRGRNRDVLNRLTDREGIRTSTLGGSPFGPALLSGELAALVEMSPTTVFDSAHLLLAVNADAVVGTPDGRLVEAAEVRRWFTHLVSSQHRAIPPYIAAKTETIFETIAGHAQELI